MRTHKRTLSEPRRGRSSRASRRFSPGAEFKEQNRLEDRASTSTLFYLDPGMAGLGSLLQAIATVRIENFAANNQLQEDGVHSTDDAATESLDSAGLPNITRRLAVGFHYVDGGMVNSTIQAPAQYAPAPGNEAVGTSSFEIDVTHSHDDSATNNNGAPAVTNTGADTITTAYSGTSAGVVTPVWIAVEGTSPNSSITASFNAAILGSNDPRYNVYSTLVINSPYMVVVDNADDPVTGNFDNGLVVENATATVIYYADPGFGNDQGQHATPTITSAPAIVGVTNFPPPAIPVSYASSLTTSLFGARAYATGETVGGAIAFSWTFQLSASG
jgi:hypothetical protein